MSHWRSMTPAEELSLLLRSKVPTWPPPNGARIDPQFRWIISTPDCAPRASRYLFRGQPLGLAPSDIGVIDMSVSGVMKISGQTPVNAEGRQVSLSVEGYAPPDLGPTGFSGMYVIYEWSRVGFDTTRATYWSVLPQDPLFHDMGPSQTTHLVGGPNDWNLLVEQLGPNPDFTANWATNFGWQTVSECHFVLPGFELAPAALGAEFNGVDAYIELDHNTPTYSGPFRFEADIQRNDLLDMPILGRKTSTSRIGIIGDDAVRSTITIGTSGLPPVGQWFKFRFEFEWTSGLQLRYEVFVDDVNVAAQTAGRINAFQQVMGVRRLNNPVSWGNFNMKNLLFQHGTPAVPVTILDMPLIDNALDLGPDANHGTTFNMPLPST